MLNLLYQLYIFSVNHFKIINVNKRCLLKLKLKGECKMRKTRSDCTLRALIKKTGIPGTAFRNPNGRKTRIDKLVGTMRKELKVK